MPTPPKLTADQRSAALAKSTAARQVRAAVKARVKTGELSLSSVFELAMSDEALAKMRVVELLESFSGVGKVRAISILDRLAISQTRRIQGLGTAQRKNLLREFPDRSSVAVRGKLLVLSGPGGVGKSTVAKALRKRNEFWVSVSATTRTARHNEVDGVDYFFYTENEFDNAVKSDLFLEWAEFAGNRYGTPRKPVEDALRDGQNVLLEIEISGKRERFGSHTDLSSAAILGRIGFPIGRTRHGFARETSRAFSASSGRTRTSGSIRPFCRKYPRRRGRRTPDRINPYPLEN